MRNLFQSVPVASALLALTLAAYSNCFEAGFTLDSRPLLLQDPRLRAASAENVGLIFQHTYWWPYAETGLYRPFTTLSYLFNYAELGNGEHAVGYHAVNLVLHALNVLLVYALTRRWMAGRWVAAVVAALWAVHPVLTESVTNIVGRADLLAGAAILGGFWIYLESREAAGFRRFAWLAALAAVTTIGVFSKESAVAILGVIAIYELAWWNGRQPLIRLLPAYVAVQVPILAMWMARSAVLAAAPRAVFGFTDNPLVGAGFWQAKLTALAVLGRYLWLMLWPAHLSADYSYAQIPMASGSLADWAAWLAVAAALTSAALLFRRNRAAAFWLLFAFINVAPVANLLFPIGTIMAERFLYVPSLAVCTCAVMAARARLRPQVSSALALVLVAALAIRTYARNADWRDDLSLATADAEASPASYKVHHRVAAALYESDPSHANIASVTAEVEKGLAIVDPLPDSRNTPTIYDAAGGFYLVEGGRTKDRSAYERSKQILQRGLAIVAALRGAGLHPAYSEEAEMERMLSADHLRLDEMPQALGVALQARRLDPLAPAMYWQLFNVLISQERADEAATVLIEGGIATGDAKMRQELVRLYQLGLDHQGCAVAATGALNPDCEIVHHELCASAAGLGQLARETPRTDLKGQFGKIPRLPGCATGAK